MRVRQPGINIFFSGAVDARRDSVGGCDRAESRVHERTLIARCPSLRPKRNHVHWWLLTSDEGLAVAGCSAGVSRQFRFRVRLFTSLCMRFTKARRVPPSSYANSYIPLRRGTAGF